MDRAGPLPRRARHLRRYQGGARPARHHEPGRIVRAIATIYVNPACSKCRTALAILRDEGVEATQLHYLDVPPTVEDLRRLMGMLGIDDPRAMMRPGESLYTELGLDDATPDELLAAVAANPILLERPIFVVGDRAVIARPPERVRELYV